MGHTGEEKLLARAGQRHIEFTVYQHTVLLGEVGEKLQLMEAVDAEGVDDDISLTALVTLYGINHHMA